MRPGLVINLGCGPPGSGHALPKIFDGWRELRVDIDPAVGPDVTASLTDLSPFADETVDAVWCAHAIEHLYEHEVRLALLEFHRVLKPDGFVCIIVPDLQSVAGFIASDKMHEPIYQSQGGPITAHDILFGHGAAIAKGRTAMAHRCGFTPSMMIQHFDGTPFEEVMLTRRPNLELGTLACRRRSRTDAEREELMEILRL